MAADISPSQITDRVCIFLFPDVMQGNIEHHALVLFINVLELHAAYWTTFEYNPLNLFGNGQVMLGKPLGKGNPFLLIVLLPL